MTKGAKLSMLMISFTFLLMAAFMSGMIKSDHWKISNIVIDAEFKRVNSEQIRLTVATSKERSFFKLNANQIRDNLMQIPWVSDVSVNKKWPNTLHIRLKEHKAVAVWNEKKLLNSNGDIFEVDSLEDLSSLPHFNSKANNSKIVWNKFMRFNDIIKNIGFDITACEISSIGSWNIVLNNGINIVIGTNYQDAKLVRLAETWQALLKTNETLPSYIDLRYTNGYAVKWQKLYKNLINSDDNKLEVTKTQEYGNSNG